jgi:ATP-binding cassette subfamily B multidrug efflux pump
LKEESPPPIMPGDRQGRGRLTVFRFLTDVDVLASARAHRRRLAAGALAILGRGLLALGGPFLLGRSIDIVAGVSARPIARELLLLLAFAAVTAACQFSMRWIVIGWSRETERRMRDALFARLLRLPAATLDRSRTGDFLARLNSDVEAVRMGYGPGVMHAAATLLTTAGAVALMLHAHAGLTALAAVPLLGLFLSMRRLLPEIHDLSMRVQEFQSLLSTRAQESFSGARVVKAFAQEEAEGARFAELSRETMAQNLRLADRRALLSALVEGLGGLSLVVVVGAGGVLVIRGALTPGTFTAFLAYLTQLVWPMIALGWTLSLYQRAEASKLRLDALRNEETVQDSGLRRIGAHPGIEIRDLHFAYGPAAPAVLAGVSLTARPGDFLGVVGRTASGKSTLLHLILRIYEPPPGTIFLDGVDVREIRLDELRRRVTLVPQETFLFSDTIAANIAFGAEAPTREDIERAARTAGLGPDLAEFPDGLDTRIGERGITLSGGQRQRVALARAILHGAPVILLDDALSAVDTATERSVRQAMARDLGGRTLIFATHRLSGLADADEIVVLDQGRIIERGRHAGLLAARGLYARLARRQQDERELESL